MIVIKMDRKGNVDDNLMMACESGVGKGRSICVLYLGMVIRRIITIYKNNRLITDLYHKEMTEIWIKLKEQTDLNGPWSRSKYLNIITC